MPEQQYRTKYVSPEEAQELLEEDEVRQEETAKKIGEEALKNIDELLDEIDEVLETNAEEFVSGYIQKGGE